MTRETKIGLLVGLAFIIVIGILLSDHLTQTNEPQQAQLAQVAGNVRTGVAVPGGAQAPASSAGAVTPATQQGIAATDRNSAPVAWPLDQGAGSIANVAHTMGEEVISLEHPAASKTEAPAAPQPQKPLLVASLPAGARQYKAEAGDSL